MPFTKFLEQSNPEVVKDTLLSTSEYFCKKKGGTDDYNLFERTFHDIIARDYCPDSVDRTPATLTSCPALRYVAPMSSVGKQAPVL